MPRLSPGRRAAAFEPEACAVNERLRAQIRAEIAAAGGRLSFARYMELALYSPALGYYSGGAAKFGEVGDFTTAAEKAPLFGRCLARQCHELLQRIPGGGILEFGAGSGQMAARLLTELRRMGREHVRYDILELSAELQHRQRQTIHAGAPWLANQVHWLQRLPEPASFRGVAIANEVLDAMPVHLFRRARGRIQEGFVRCREGQFELVFAAPPTAALAERVAAIECRLGAFPEGYRSEVCLALTPWLRGLSQALAVGAILLIDYGYSRREYYRPQRSQGTLLCHYRHRVCADPLVRTGLQDITAHVDFTSVAEAAVAAGLEIAGYTTQAHFLLGNGLLEMVAESDPGDIERYAARASEVRLLTLPSAMGERFRVLGLQKGVGGAWSGFSLRDLRAALSA